MTSLDSSELTASADVIARGDATLGIEFGSTRIKAVLIDPSAASLASGAHDWENHMVDGLWSYPIEDVWAGLQDAYAKLAAAVKETYGVELRRLRGLGISAMMHGYLALDAEGNLLAPFRTWRNVNTGPATEVLSKELDFNMPHRWSAAHLYQAILDREPHVERLDYLTTLSGLVHRRLTGERVLGIGDASGMFPIDSGKADYDQRRVEIFDGLIAERGFPWTFRDVFPKVLVAGEDAGVLTAEGAALIDPSGTLQPGVPMCPPEGDAGTGMVATNAVAPRTGNVSAGTSIFAMVVLERDLLRVHPELDMVTTPAGSPVAMVHSNNGASEWDQWVGVFGELIQAAGFDLPKPALYDLLYAQALAGDPAGGDLVAYNFLSGEPIVELEGGRPLIIRSPETKITLANFMRTQLMSIFGVLRIGMDILLDEEKVSLDRLYAHGGLFKTPLVSQKIMAAALRTPVDVGAMAAEGGSWGIALLALYRAIRGEGQVMGADGEVGADRELGADRKLGAGQSLSEFLEHTAFAQVESNEIAPDPADVAGFDAFLERYRAALPAADAAATSLL